MICVKKEGVLLRASKESFECDGVLNPAVISDEVGIHLFYRAVGKGNYSSIGYCRLSAPLDIAWRYAHPVIIPEHSYEKNGIEDPRIVKIDEEYLLTYTAYDGINALGALVTSKDLTQWQKQGVLVPIVVADDFDQMLNPAGLLQEKYVRYNQIKRKEGVRDPNTYLWDKNLIFFPRKINESYCFLHRIKPDIQIVTSIKKWSELTEDFWSRYLCHLVDQVVISPKYDHEVSYVGGGCPPIETPEGWLFIYHGVHDTIDGYVYSACAALLRLDDPRIEISRLPYPLFVPDQEYELAGSVKNVCFPTGALVFQGRIYIYYGAADQCIAVASVDLNELLIELLMFKK